MRISTAQIYSSNVTTINQQQAERLHTQQQLSTGMRVLTPSDDPVAAARALVVSQSVSLNSMQMESQGIATDSLSLLDKTLGSITDIISYIKDRAIQANVGSLCPSEKECLATTLRDTTLSAPAYAAAISTVEGQLDNAMDNVLRLDSQTGSRMVEVDALTSMSEDLHVQYSATISRLVGVDYVSAISSYQQQGTYLEAALSTFSKITGLSLFNYIGN